MVRLSLARLKYLNNLNTFIIIAWIITFILHERILTYYTVQKCSWPDLHLSKPDENNVLLQTVNADSIHPKATKVLLVADPQLIDNHTYPGRNPLLLKLSQHTVDIYLKKNYNYLIDQLQPDYIFFLGDYLDNGRSSTDEYFQQELTRFNKIFHNKKFQKKYKKGINYFLNVPGNHDIGFGEGVKVDSRLRFESQFSEADSNMIHTIENVDFITFDALSYSSGTQDINSVSYKFMEDNFGPTIVKTNPRVLLTHVPLYRDPSVSCGPLRENPDFNVYGQGYQYKSTIDKGLSEHLLFRMRPDLIFAGDDHDYCDMVHENFGGTREITVKSISMAMGIKYPAVQLLSFTNQDTNTNRRDLKDDFEVQEDEIVKPATSESAQEEGQGQVPVEDQEQDQKITFQYETRLCYLQTPYVNVVSYVILAVISGLLVLIWNIKHAGSSRFHYSSLLPLNEPTVHSNSTKIRNFLREQDEDGNETGNSTIDNNIKESDTGYSGTSFSLPSTTNKLLHIPNYTFTKSLNSSSESFFSNTKWGQWITSKVTNVNKIIKKYNLGSFLKQSILLAVAVIAIYYILFCLTL
ncbi:protein that affects bud emergence, intrachromosomal recombination, and nuclear division [Scheffersomyces coipomensis]|uniref:protein that affects bud emergence, intrachromosomal recombination, and nuclear division n=1 Tax=Scheffersomyces coipomensis TaxID=1788519 RepID=UPI00315D6DA3